MARGERGGALGTEGVDTMGLSLIGTLTVEEVLHAVGQNKGAGYASAYIDGILEELFVVVDS